MDTPKEKHISSADVLVAQIRDRARNLYESKQFLCTEAVVSAMNFGLNGGLSDTQATAMAAPFSAAMGESGCLCGALSGAVLSSGLLLGQKDPYSHRKAIRKASRQLHDAFKAANGATCCWVLSRKVRHDKKAHFHKCSGLTAQAAEMAARLVLEKRPELIARNNNIFLKKRQSIVGGTLLRLFSMRFWRLDLS